MPRTTTHPTPRRPRIGDTRVYLSSRAVGGYPYLALAQLRVHETRDGRLVWRPEGTLSRPRGFGVPSSWYRAGTRRAREAMEAYGDAPRPWAPVEA